MGKYDKLRKGGKIGLRILGVTGPTRLLAPATGGTVAPRCPGWPSFVDFIRDNGVSGAMGIVNMTWRELFKETKKKNSYFKKCKAYQLHLSALLEDSTARISAKPLIQLPSSTSLVSPHASLSLPPSLFSSCPRFLALPLSPFRYSSPSSYRGIRFSRTTFYWDWGGISWNIIRIRNLPFSGLTGQII